jgi:hypothetical protein
VEHPRRRPRARGRPFSADDAEAGDSVVRGGLLLEAIFESTVTASGA